MSVMIDRLIAEMVADNMIVIKKMKKDELLQLTKELLVDNFRELDNATIVEIYEERYNTVLAGV